jgi:putative addiction module component (TIGR02574 family)
MALSPDDRAILAHTLWDSIHTDTSATREEALREVRRRAEEMASGADPGVSHEEVMREARRLLECD